MSAGDKGAAGAPPGSRTVNTEPLPGSLATVMSPPIIWQKRRLITRPRPVPPYLLAVVEEAWENSWNSESALHQLTVDYLKTRKQFGVRGACAFAHRYALKPL